jgi:sterol desaturase/sphingolipid hydroxylase (fatty acid hydroxylase superfamily)
MMNAPVLGVMIPMVICTGMFAMIFGIFYLRNRERMAMIERGMNPKARQDNSNMPNTILTWGLLLVGSGLGLLIAYFLDNMLPFAKEQDNPAIYFALIALFGGLGLYLAYHIQRKEDKNKTGE